MHLFDALNYRDLITSRRGMRSACWTRTSAGVGIQICYDCRFPELARTQVLKGADLVRHGLLPGAPLPVRTEHWDLLIDSMALLNQTWVCAANQLESGRPASLRRSRITDPCTAVAVAGGRPGVIYGVLDLKYQGKAGSRWAVCTTAARSYTSSNRKRTRRSPRVHTPVRGICICLQFKEKGRGPNVTLDSSFLR
ncbi:MAG: nitrilase-related carbon-nitrogen hydrolase [Flavonifractor plautii]